jgi:hypothetical protein
MRRERPEPRYKSFGHFRYTNTSPFARRRLDDPTFFPCLECEGRSRIYDPQDEPDPIEGNKLRSRIKCPACKGTGEGSYNEVKAAYEATVAGYRESLAKWEHEESLRRSGLAKLTTQEKRALGLI